MADKLTKEQRLQQSITRLGKRNEALRSKNKIPDKKLRELNSQFQGALNQLDEKKLQGKNLAKKIFKFKNKTIMVKKLGKSI
jgi:chromosome segregation ATPase